MYAIQLPAYGPSEQLRAVLLDDPEPGPGQVRIDVAASGMQLIDTWLQEGEPVAGIPAPELPYIPGAEVAGYVDAIGPGVDTEWLGTRIVATTDGGGGYAESAVADLTRVHRIPDGLDFPAAVAMATTGTTMTAIADLAALVKSDVVLVTAAAGGIGALLIQAAKRLGAKVIGAAGGDSKLEIVRELGADIAVDYNRPNWTDMVPHEVTVVLDGVGGDRADAAYRLLRDGGRIIAFGAAAQRGNLSRGTVPDRVGYQSLFESELVAQLTEPVGSREHQTRALEAAASGALVPLVQAYPLADAAQAQRDLRSRATTGKVVLLPESSTALRDWWRVAARPIHDVEADAGDADLDALTASLATGTVVGLGESTRAAHQMFTVRDRIWRQLVTRHGFRALVVQDSQNVAERYDSYVNGADGDPAALVSAAWPPWRTTEMVAALRWIRDRNAAHPGDPVRVFAAQPVTAEPADYDAVLDHVRRHAPERYDRIAEPLAVIRTAHDVNEHVQRHNGTHPGTPFTRLAHEAARLLEPVADHTINDHMGRIVSYHENSVANRGFDGPDTEELAAQRIIDHHDRTGHKIVYWDGVFHTAAVGADDDTPGSTGGRLRRHFGTGYRSVSINFQHGDIHHTAVPTPPPDFLEGDLTAIEPDNSYVDLSTQAPEPVRHKLSRPRRQRVISGVYDPANDAAAHLSGPITGWFDAIVHIRRITPTTFTH